MAECLLGEIISKGASVGMKDRLREFLGSVNDSKRMTLDAELFQILERLNGRRDSHIVARCLGWDGGGGCTLQTAGSEHGITRERARQVCARALETLRGRQFVPVLDAVLACIANHSNEPGPEIEARLRSEGLIGKPFALEGIVKAAEVFDRALPVGMRSSGGWSEVAAETPSPVVSAVLKTAHRNVSRWGALTVSDLSSEVSGQRNMEVSELSVRRMLETRADFRWLDEASGWFWLTSVPRNRLLNRIRKVLCVAPRISVSELRAGVSRDYRMQGFSPPRRALLALCAQLPWCRVSGQYIEAAAALDPVEVLSGAESVVLKVLRSHGGALALAALESFCLAAGITRPNFWHIAAFSPIVHKYALAVYGLVGAQLDPGVIEGLIPAHRRTRVLQDFGWLHDGQVWVGFKLSEAMLRAGVFGVPSSLRRFIEGEYALLASDGGQLGTLVAKASSGWGLGPLFSRRGGEAGDYLVIRFDLSVRRATAQIGGEDLLDEYRDVVPGVGPLGAMHQTI
jgi:hypothetical protein